MSNENIQTQFQRTARGIAYEKFCKSVSELLSGMTSEAQQKAARANVDFMRGLRNPTTRQSHISELEKAVTPGAVHVDTLLATMSVMYANDEYIGERLMPVVPVSKRSDKYVIYPKRERLAFPDDEIGTRGSPNELNASRTTDNYSVHDYGYKNFLDLEVVQNQDAPLNEMVDLIQALNEGIAFRREKRILAVLNTTGNYTTTAGPGTVWSDTTGGTIVADVATAISTLWRGMTPTNKIGFTTLEVWNKGFLGNPVLRDLFKFVQAGLASPTQIAGYFGLDDILISRSREDTANIGQTASYARMMTNKYFGVLAVAKQPTLRSLHYGTTFRMAGDPYTTEWPDPMVGKRGGIYAKVAVSEDHKVVAPDAGYLVTAAIS